MATKSIAWGAGTGNITLTYDGQGDGSIVVTSDPNDLPVPRSKTVNVIAGNITRPVTINQAAHVATQYFYVYHSATGIIERFAVQPHFNLVDKVTSGRVYAGYCNVLGADDKAGGDYARAIKAGTFEQDYPSVQFVDNKLQDINCYTYDGSSLTARDADNKSFRLVPARGYFYTDQNASDFTPVADTIYYLVEPLANYYKLRFVYPSAAVDSNRVLQCYGFWFAVDHNLLSSLKYYIDDVEVASTTLDTSQKVNYTVNGSNKTLTVNASALGLSRCYVAASNAICKSNTSSPFALNTQYTIKGRITFLDGYVMDTQTILLNTADGTTDHMSVRYVS